jgi:hypothetical protein
MTHSVVVTEDYRVAGKPRFGVELNGHEVFHCQKDDWITAGEAKRVATQMKDNIEIGLALGDCQ